MRVGARRGASGRSGAEWGGTGSGFGSRVILLYLSYQMSVADFTELPTCLVDRPGNLPSGCETSATSTLRTEAKNKGRCPSAPQVLMSESSQAPGAEGSQVYKAEFFLIVALDIHRIKIDLVLRSSII